MLEPTTITPKLFMPSTVTVPTPGVVASITSGPAVSETSSVLSA